MVIATKTFSYSLKGAKFSSDTNSGSQSHYSILSANDLERLWEAHEKRYPTASAPDIVRGKEEASPAIGKESDQF